MVSVWPRTSRSSSRVGGIVGPPSKLSVPNYPDALGWACWWLSTRLAGRWCSWLVCPWRWLVGLWLPLSNLSEGRRPEDRHFCRYPPRSSKTPVPCTRSPESAGQFFVKYFVMGLMVGSRRFSGAIDTGERVQVPHLPTIVCLFRRLVPKLATDRTVDGLRGGVLPGGCAVAAATNFVYVVATMSRDIFLCHRRLSRHILLGTDQALSAPL